MNEIELVIIDDTYCISLFDAKGKTLFYLEMAKSFYNKFKNNFEVFREILNNETYIRDKRG